ncbi:triose-phosphate isomerase [Cellvibrio japonicus]|nr:triose-phosphate isomerase [Cellvibrio japonicus]QEI13032.1 triose-phosphate isomerase [Cellvibrio japonicus]QEI16606.1 triose-phosphate isomerase [Cellvibrio japonicus]QEI20184.1 triose-phosphate isomerase [Cellvibrio japonicus]
MWLYVYNNLASISARFGGGLLLINASNTKRRQLVVGNWKMNGNRQENAALLAQILSGWPGQSPVQVVICPPFPYLYQVRDTLQGSAIELGAQNVNEEEKGALTGEVSAHMLADMDCKFAIIGHNERRRLQGETDDRVARKFIAAQHAGLIPILCIGESVAQRDQGLHLQVISRQLNAVIEVVGLDAFANAVVAYEPVWAVGTGKTATPVQAQEVHRHIRQQLGQYAESVRVLYGGSVKAHNAKELFALPDIDGALLGGASLDAQEFLTICSAAI